MKPSFSYILRCLRRAARLTQRQLGQQAMIDQRKISRFENEMCLPDAEEATRLAVALNVHPDELRLTLGEPATPRFPLPRDFMSKFGRAPRMHRPDRAVSMRARLHSTIQENPALEPTVDRLLATPGFETLTRLADCNSGSEGEAWVYLADQGANFGRFTHSRLGWTRAPIVDATWERCLTGVLWPALYVVEPRPMVFLPQVRVRTKSAKIRLDMNVAVGGETTNFFGVEINGEGHRSRKDSQRSKWLGMPVFFLSMEDVRKPNLARTLLDLYLSEG